MICPIIASGVTVGPPGSRTPEEIKKEAECVGSECAWWVQGRDSGCSIKLIAKAQGLKTHG